MYVYVNIFRIAFYIVLGVACFTNGVPWFVPVAWFCYDMVWAKYMKVPFTRGKGNGVQYQAPDSLDLDNFLRQRGSQSRDRGTIQ